MYICYQSRLQHFQVLLFKVSHLIRSLQLLVLHLSQHIVSCAQRPNHGVAATDKARQADKPQAVAVTQQTLGPHLRHRRVGLCHPLGCFDLLCWKPKMGMLKTTKQMWKQVCVF